MITDLTRRAICALLAADDQITDAERERVAFALRGGGTSVIRIGEVCQRIGRSRPTVWRLVRKGYLVGVPGSGDSGNISGVTLDSLERYMSGKVVKKV